MPESLSYIHVTRFTPAPAVFLQGILASLFLLVGDIAALIEFASFLIWFFYGSAMVALLCEYMNTLNIVSQFSNLQSTFSSKKNASKHPATLQGANYPSNYHTASCRFSCIDADHIGARCQISVSVRLYIVRSCRLCAVHLYEKTSTNYEQVDASHSAVFHGCAHE